MTVIDPLFEILAEAIDPEAFRVDDLSSHLEMRRRNALSRAKTGIRIAQALGWRFIPPGEFEILGEDQLDAHCERAKRNMRDAADNLGGQKNG